MTILSASKWDVVITWTNIDVKYTYQTSALTTQNRGVKSSYTTIVFNMNRNYNNSRKRVLKTCLHNGQSIFNFYGHRPDEYTKGIGVYYHRSAKFFITKQNKMFKSYQWRYLESVRGLF